ncbi:hypothetical protein L210DRAFT_3499164 [Boletus edulis BED1]|uniref:Uncharacterized protein n=1 Tax=Boletus edulis BED1 TaxID=1328754 RepID=A0AAD4C8R9_BOLED|nr:hypothetical protein L210DRAFT_3499164 [Boletus edulis BED1]
MYHGVKADRELSQAKSDICYPDTYLVISNHCRLSKEVALVLVITISSFPSVCIADSEEEGACRGWSPGPGIPPSASARSKYSSKILGACVWLRDMSRKQEQLETQCLPVIGFIAKSVAHICKGEMHKGYRTCDIAFEHFHSSHLGFLLLTKIAGWEFDLLDILIQQRLCEALYALGRTMELLWTKKSTSGFLTLRNNVSRPSKTLVSQLRTHPSMTPIPLLREWAMATLASISFGFFNLSAFTQRRLFAHGDAASNTNRDANMSTIHTTLPPLLREWAKAKLTHGSWKDALLSAVGFAVSRVEIVCEHLETIDRIVDAVECVHEMTSELGEETLKLHDEYLAWAFSE